jgi:hypothetical protein
VLGQHRSTQRRVPTGPDDEERLTADIVELARRHGRLGYRKTAEMLRSTAGWIVNDKRVERIWRGAEGPRQTIQARSHLACVAPHRRLRISNVGFARSPIPRSFATNCRPDPKECIAGRMRKRRGGTKLIKRLWIKTLSRHWPG